MKNYENLIKTHKDYKQILDNRLFKIILYNDIKLDNIVLNLLYVTIKDNFMMTITDFETINKYNQEFLKGLGNIYDAFNQIYNSKLAIIYDLTKVSSIFPPTILWNIGKFFSSKKEITNNILYCTSIITSSVQVNNIIQTFINIYDNIKPINLCTNQSDAFNFINQQVSIYNEIINDDIL